LMQSTAIRVFDEMFYLLLFGSTGFKVAQFVIQWLSKLGSIGFNRSKDERF